MKTKKKHKVNKTSSFEYMKNVQKHKPLFLRHARMDADWREVALHKKFVQLSSSTHTLYKDDNLVKIQSIQKVIQLAIFL